MANRPRIRINRTYRFIDKDPVIAEVGEFIKRRGLTGQYAKIALLASMNPSTIANWYEGDTKRPQHCSVASVVTALGGRFGIVADESVGRKDWVLEAELKKAHRWMAENKPNKPKQKQKKKIAALV